MSLRGGSDDERRASAFELSRDLMRRTGYDVQPDLPSGSLFPPGGSEAADPNDATVLAAEIHPPGTEDRAWALDAMRIRTAWANSGSRGAGILVGQPDTGNTPGAGRALDLARGRDLVDDNPDPTDPLTHRLGGGHRELRQVTGSAPQATLVPLRSNRSVVLVLDDDVARAVESARESGCQVITMSLGGVGFCPALRAAIDAAVADAIIVLAAAGNHVGLVVTAVAMDDRQPPSPASPPIPISANAIMAAR